MSPQDILPTYEVDSSLTLDSIRDSILSPHHVKTTLLAPILDHLGINIFQFMTWRIFASSFKNTSDIVIALFTKINTKKCWNMVY